MPKNQQKLKPNILLFIFFFNPWKTGAQMPNKITRWEPRLARNLADDISTTWLHHYILLSIIFLFES